MSPTEITTMHTTHITARRALATVAMLASPISPHERASINGAGIALSHHKSTTALRHTTEALANAKPDSVATPLSPETTSGPCREGNQK